MSIDKTRNSLFDIEWARGDNDAKIFTIVDPSGVVIDISTWTLRMAVNTDLNPTDTVNQLLDVLGVFVTDGTDGKVSFTPTAASLDNVTANQIAYYDINRVTPSKKTLMKGKVTFIMDISKT